MTENDITGLLLKLADLGVSGIKVDYSGGGDSGCIDGIMYTTETLDKIEEEKAFEYISQLHYASPNLSDLDSSVYSDIEDFANDKILGDIEDWWNNDGGYGILSILVPSGKYTIENSIYITNTEHYTHAGDLINQSLK